MREQDGEIERTRERENEREREIHDWESLGRVRAENLVRAVLEEVAALVLVHVLQKRG